ncbi:MAG: hypothetical protein J7480_08205, partial [Microbacteriaceae bacterium]|nr:hypothetical protein [Microbacteriaceae bacterium]
HLTAALDRPDTTWFVSLLDVNPSGVGALVTKGWLRASHRATSVDAVQPYKVHHPHTGAEPVPVGVPVEYAIDLGETSQYFRPGHRIAIEIKAQDGDAVHFWHHGEPHEVRHDIGYGPGAVSKLLLPVIPPGAR